MDFLEDYSDKHESSDSNNSETSDSEVSELLKFGDINFENLTKRLSTLSLECLCKNPVDKGSCLSLMDEMIFYDISGDKYACIIDNITRCFNLVSKNTEIEDPYRLGFCDLFYRLRHELLFKGLMLSLNLPVDKSDVAFSSFGINSERTPDLIIMVKKTLVIIEVSASSNFENAARMKGLNEYGFESKYQKEIDMLIGLNVPHIYLPFIFDMSDSENVSYIDQFEKASVFFKINDKNKILLKVLSKSLCDLTCFIKEFLIPSSMILFSTYIPIQKKHESLEFLYNTNKDERTFKNHYKEFYVSTPTYRKVHNNWLRIPNFLNRLRRSGSKNSKCYILLIDIKTNRLNFVEDQEGRSVEDIESMYLNNDKPEIFKITFLSVGDRLIRATDSETGVLFRECVKTKAKKRLTNYPDMSCLLKHEGSEFVSIFNTDKYVSIINKYYSQVYNSNDYDEDYERVILESYKKYDSYCLPNIDNEVYVGTDLNLLSDMPSEKLKINDVVSKMVNDHVILNTNNDEIPLKVFKTKNPFIMPLSELCSSDYEALDFKNISLIDFLISEIALKNPYTSILLDKVKNLEYNLYEKPKQKSEFLTKLYNDKLILSQELTKNVKQKLRMISKTEKRNKFNSVDLFEGEERERFLSLRNEISSCDKRIKEREKSEGVKREIGLIRLPTKNKKSEMGERFSLEMSHFKEKGVQSSYKGVGIVQNFEKDHEKNKGVFDSIRALLSDYRGENPDRIIDDNVYDDSKMLMDLKNKSLSDYRCLLNEVRNSFLGHASAFVSRLGHSLMFYSQLPFNSDYVRVDNLGYNCCFLIVRGGKKVFRSKSSKLFRVFYPINDTIIPWLEGSIERPSSSQILRHNGRAFILSPWMMWNESILTDSLSFYTRVVSFTVLNIGPGNSMKEMFIKVAINVLLAFHNRRQTEVLLANMRYILLSTLGDFTGIQGVLPDFVGFNYDYFQSFIRSSILKNYPEYFASLVNVNKRNKSINQNSLKEANVKNIFTSEKIVSSDDLTLMIYSTFLMTKAPYQKIAERANNLKGILKIQEQYDTEIGVKITPEEQYHKLSVCLKKEESLKDYMSKLFGNDFNFDPKYCANLGVFADSYFNNRNLKDKLHTEWLRIMSKPWDSLATSTGLRGDSNDKKEFWGQKGYFVVYKNLSNRPGYVENVKKALCSDNLTDDERRREIRKLNKMYINEVTDRVDEPLVFHVVDKVQWRGSREIYVMDLNTKTLQQPIEQFMGELCKNLENELISIPSDRRAQVIHHTIFEKDLPLKDILTWYLTLDCTKWAPKSIFVKFAITIINMECIPPSFKTHFLNYLDRLYKKKVYFNNSEVEALKNNNQYTDLVNKFLLKDENVDGYYMFMPYSWVMGIFNYTSSFLHAINQLYASYLISKSALENLGEDVSLTMFAHSDDSGGRLSCRTKSIAQRCLMLYEINLKSANHLISRKKSVISKIYFEILSIIYLFKKLLALLPKFLGGLRFLPTDKGPAQDLLQSYSKCNEVIVAGANFSMAYIVLKMVSMMIWRFYFNRQPIKSDYERPVQYLGMPDSHPLLVLISGSDSDVIRLITINKMELLKSQMVLANKISESADEPGPIRPFKYNINVKNIGKDFKEELNEFSELLTDWSIKNVNFASTPFNMINFLSKLNDPGFVGSMTNESTVRRFSRCYYLRSSDSLLTRNGFTSSEKVINSFDKLRIIMEGSEEMREKIIETHYSEESEFWLDLKENMKFAEPQMKVLLNVLSGPLKICKYLDQMSLKNRDLKKVGRTIKPTHIQLYKTGRTFSVDFDPAQLVAYVKDSNFRWALPGLKRIETASKELYSLCSSLGIDIELTDENTLLKLCRNYNTKNVKDIYIYSQIPSEIRSIKTYSAFLSFIATNSFEGYEIGGLTLSLGNQITDPGYLITQVEESTYNINTVLILLLSMAKEDLYFLNNLNLRALGDLNWKGGTILEFLEFVNSLRYTDPDYPLLKLQSTYLHELIRLGGNFGTIDARNVLTGSSYYIFTKEQKSKSGWRGAGELLIVFDEDHFLFKIYNDKITFLETNQIGKLNKYRFGFISDVLIQCGIRIDPNSFKSPSVCSTDLIFGYDYSGDISICNKRECSSGIECVVGPIRSKIIDGFYFSNIKHIKNDIFVVNAEISGVIKSIKINCLRPKNSEFATIASQIFIESEFQSKLDEMGLSTLEEFIFSELLIKMGAEAQVKFDDFYDNFASSKLYKIIKMVDENDSSFIPTKVETSQMPASKGGLFRIFIEYENLTGEQVIRTPSYITPEILSIRNEFPEKFSLILRDKMSECYNNLFDESEKEEFYNSYLNIIEIDDTDLLRSKLINLMCYWGYDSLVNSLNLFTFNKDKENYKTFRISKSDSRESQCFSDFFVEIIKIIISVLDEFSVRFSDLEYPIAPLRQHSNSLEIKQIPMMLSYCLYNHGVFMLNYPLYWVVFINTLTAIMKDDDFNRSLSDRFKNLPAISTLPIDYQNHKEFIATINTLFYTWCRNGCFKDKMFLNPVPKIQRLPGGLPQPVKIAQLFDPCINVVKGVLHHNFLDQEFYNSMKKNLTFSIEERKFFIIQKFEELSDRLVPNNKFFRFKRPLKEEFFESDLWEDFECELDMPDNELEDIEGFIDDTGLEIEYKPSEIKVRKKKGKFREVEAIIKWVILPGVMGANNVIKRLRQVGENVVLISDVYYSGIYQQENGFAKIVDLSQFCGVKLPKVIAHITCNKKLNKAFWDFYLPGEEFDPIADMFEVLNLRLIRDNDSSLKNCFDIGSKSINLFSSSKEEVENELGGSDVLSKESEFEQIENSDPESLSYNKAIDYIEIAKSRSEITDELALELTEKYKKLRDDFLYLRNKPEKLDLKSLLKDMKIDTVMKLIKNDILLNLTKEQIKKILQSPEHFGMAHGISDPGDKHIRDRHVKAELDSIEKDLMSLISSGNLTMTKKMKNLCRSSFRLWTRNVKMTRYKVEQKNFLLTLFLTITSDSSIVVSSESDEKWQRILNRVQIKIAEEDDEDESEDDEHKFRPVISTSSRLFYRAVNR